MFWVHLSIRATKAAVRSPKNTKYTKSPATSHGFGVFATHFLYQWPATVYSHPHVTHVWIRDEGPIVGPRTQEEDAHERDSTGSAQ